jgi:protocatechuate 3,4-dioxygenase beta subunit
VAVAGLLAAAGQTAQPPRRPESPPVLSGTASIEGLVIDAATQQPIAGADVLLSDSQPTTERNARSTRVFMRTSDATTDREGRFAFRRIAAGTYRVRAVGPHYVSASVPTSVEAGQLRDDIVLPLSAGGTITGVVIDHSGRPLANVSVVARQMDNQSVGISRSDAAGRFEIDGIRPGPAIVVAEMAGQPGAGHYRVFYPNVVDRDSAQPIQVNAGHPIDIELRVPAFALAAITARVSGPGGFTIDKLTLAQPTAKTHLSVRTEDGVGRVIDLPPGRFVLAARATAEGKALAAFAFVDLHEDDLDVPLQLQPAGEISGKLVVDRGGQPPVEDVRVAAVWVGDGLDLDPMGADEVGVGPDGSFRFKSLFGTRMIRVHGLPSNWHVTAIRAGRSDITTSGVDVDPGSTTEISIVVSRR